MACKVAGRFTPYVEISASGRLTAEEGAEAEEDAEVEEDVVAVAGSDENEPKKNKVEDVQ